MGGTEPIVVVIVDDHGLFSRGLELLLSAASEGRIKVAERTESADEALALARRNRPQVALVDLAMPPPGGVGAIREIAHHYPEVRILALSGTDDRDLAVAALAAGAHGFIPKSSDPDVLVPPLLSLGGGLSVLPPPLPPAPVGLRATRPPGAPAQLQEGENALGGPVAPGLQSLQIAPRALVS